MAVYGKLINNEIKEQEQKGDNNEVLNEIRVYTNNEDNVCITVDGDGEKDRGFNNDPYFKYYNNSNPKKATKVSRIAFTGEKIRYIIHNNQDNKLNSSEKKKLNEYMDRKSTNKDYKDITVWEAIKKAAEQESSSDNTDKISSASKPDFTNIESPKKKK